MKKILLFAIAILLINACGSVNKRLQKGDYDGVINMTVKDLIKNPTNEDDIQLLDRAYKLANERDLERVKYLKTENNPNNYDEIFARYEALKSRQARVRTVLPLNLNGRTINYDYVDYDAEIVTAKRKAAEYYYTNGQKLMGNPDKESARQAYYQLIRAQQYSGDSYPNLNELITEARYRGMSRVIVEVVSSDRVMVAPIFRDELLTFNTQGLNSEWVEFHFRHLNEEMDYQYAVIINLLDIIVSPEDTKQKDLIYKKDIPDGFNYALDARGNVMKDSAGNDVKIPKYKNIQCTLIETTQKKSVVIRGQVEITELLPMQRLLVKEPIGAENHFEHVSARAVGEVEALDDAAKQKIKTEYIPYPPDLTMIVNTAETLKPAIRDAIYRNRLFIK
jgi:hypothetical protein